MTNKTRDLKKHKFARSKHTNIPLKRKVTKQSANVPCNAYNARIHNTISTQNLTR